MAGERRAYMVQDAGSPSRMGKVYKVCPYTLKALFQALDDARFRSFAEVPQLIVRVNGRQRTVIRRFEHGREVSLALAMAGPHGPANQTPGGEVMAPCPRSRADAPADARRCANTFRALASGTALCRVYLR